MDAVSDPSVTEVWVMKSAQVGWTEILANVVGYHVDQDPAPMLLVQPSIELAEAWSKDRLAPMIRDTPALRGRIADAKSRDSGNTILHKSFTGGRLTIAGANAPRGLASRPIRIVLFDEVDGYPASAGTEGDPISLGTKRTTTFWNKKILGGSTPLIKGSSRIEQKFEESDQRYYFVPCPHCDEFQRLLWPNVRWPDGRPELAVYVCPHCGAEIDEAGRRWMIGSEPVLDAAGVPVIDEVTGQPQSVPRGEWRSNKPSVGVAGFHISELYSPWSSLAAIAIAFLKAKALPETLQTWVNTSLGETWEDKGEALEAGGLLARRESYTANSLPPGVLMLTMGTDVQADRLECTVWGWGKEEEAFRVEHIVLRGDPSSQAFWAAEHDAVLRRRWRTDDGRELVIEATAIDSGGHSTQAVYEYAVKRKRFRVWAIKGMAGFGRLAWPKKASRTSKSRADLFLIGVDTIKDVIYGRLKKIAEPGPGYIHLDASTDETAVEQITSETIVHKVVQGRRVRMWKPKASGARNEQLDTLVYAYAAMIGRGGGAVLARRNSNPLHVEQEQPVVDVPAPPAPEQPAAALRRPQQIRPRRGGWVTGWKR